MAHGMDGTKITWAQFEKCNPNVQVAFENMCRWLFNDYFFAGNALLQADPNNPGVEVIPIFHSSSKKYISFQSKYFLSKIDYSQIEHSVDTAIAHYSGKLDIIYLYCNKDVTSTSKSYRRIVNKLAAHEIEIIPIANRAILDHVMNCASMALYYFNDVLLSREWFNDQIKNSITSLGPRFNHNFNVQTQTEKLLTYFLCIEDTAKEINKRKEDLLNKLFKEYRSVFGFDDLLFSYIKKIYLVEDVSRNNLLNCLSWEEWIKESCEKEIVQIKGLIEEKKKEWAMANEKGDRNLSNKISEEKNLLADFERLPHQIMPDIFHGSLLNQQVLIVKGNAGAGKSQMVAVAAEKLVNSGDDVILLLGTQFLGDHSAVSQITDILGVNITFDDLLGKLEASAIRDNKFSYIFIDALNESVYKAIWRNALDGIIAKLKSYPHIKMVLTVRSGYEKLVFSDKILSDIHKGDIGIIDHRGFVEESIQATLIFLNHYGIPFLPSYFLQSEITNPLFLTMFCETFSDSGNSFDMFTLFERVISKADDEAQKSVGYDDPIPVLNHLIDEMADIRLKKGSLTISQQELFQLDFWRTYGLEHQKIPFIRSLERSKFLISMASGDTESYYLGYNLLEDFVCAKTIIKRYPNKESLIPFLRDELLEIKDGIIVNYINIDIFVITCGLFAEIRQEECFSEIYASVMNENDKCDIANRYIESFFWRKASSVRADEFREFINTYSVDRDTVFRILIENSTKEYHPLNATFLHEILINKTMPYRDALWTTFINGLADEEERVFQLIEYLDQGSMLSGISKENAELLLILFTWFFASSNRFLRDKASKATIEILKYNFDFCEPLLQRFSNVNDPYILQRLLGVVFGACMKRVEDNINTFEKLAIYVYGFIFDQEYVYPDVLTRDYARLIIERFLYENPEKHDNFDLNKITPPYKSHPIPVVEEQEYYDQDNLNSGFNSIDRSMRVDHPRCPGIYGDFGRYTFQAAFRSFVDVDIVNLYHYAMQYIRDELGYEDEYLGSYDRYPRYYRYSRNDTKKVERIGKKYQWIAMYNILARISDTHLLKEWGDEPHQFEGPWEPYIRDFDPTLNTNILVPEEVPRISFTIPKNDFLSNESTQSNEEIKLWTIKKPDFFKSLATKLMVDDEEGNAWVMLHLYDKIRYNDNELSFEIDGLKKGTQDIWFLADAYFTRLEQLSELERLPAYTISTYSFPEPSSVYQLFNREYVWSPGYKSIFKQDWMELEIQTGEESIVIEKYHFPDFENMLFDEEGRMSIPFVEKEFEKKIYDHVVKIQIMPSYSRFLWEEEYDASQIDSTVFDIPCRSLIETLNLHQIGTDGYYYTDDGILVCFDGSMANICDGLLIRKDYLDKFLVESNLKIFWRCIGEKQYFMGDFSQEWSRWGGIYTLEENTISGELEVNLQDM